MMESLGSVLQHILESKSHKQMLGCSQLAGPTEGAGIRAGLDVAHRKTQLNPRPHGHADRDAL